MPTQVDPPPLALDPLLQRTPRVHVALAVTDVEASLGFYRDLFGTEPAKIRPRYAKFAPAECAVNLALNEVEHAPAPAGPPVHFGIQVSSRDALDDVLTRMQERGHPARVEENTTCCYAVQDKAWFSDPDGNDWEVFLVTDADVPVYKSDRSSCCGPEPETGSSCCG